METTSKTNLTSRQIAAVKRQYKNSLPLLKKIETLDKKMNSINTEIEELKSILAAGEAGIKALTGYFSFELIKCEYVPQYNEDGTPKMDKDGKYQVKVQKLSYIQPEEKEEPVEDIQEDEIREIGTDNNNFDF